MRTYIPAFLATAMVLAGFPSAMMGVGAESARPSTCEDLVARGEQALNPGLNVAAAFALWREASVKCDAQDLEPVLAARLWSSQALLPENASTAGVLLDRAVDVLDRTNPDHLEALVSVLRRRSAAEVHREAPDRVEADLQVILALQEERFGQGSPEALAAQVDLLVMQAGTAVRSGQIERGGSKIQALEDLTADGAGGEATLTKETLMKLHGALKEVYEALGNPKAAKRHEAQLERLARLQ